MENSWVGLVKRLVMGSDGNHVREDSYDGRDYDDVKEDGDANNGGEVLPCLLQPLHLTLLPRKEHVLTCWREHLDEVAHFIFEKSAVVNIWVMCLFAIWNK